MVNDTRDTKNLSEFMTDPHIEKLVESILEEAQEFTYEGRSKEGSKHRITDNLISYGNERYEEGKKEAWETAANRKDFWEDWQEKILKEARLDALREAAGRIDALHTDCLASLHALISSIEEAKQ